MKCYIVIYTVLLALCASCIPLSGHEDDLQRWFSCYIADEHNTCRIPAHDLNIIANILYCSYMRSYSTICAQRVVLETIEHLWYAYENIMYRRLNPSTPIIHDNIQTTDLISFWSVYEQQQKWSDYYAHTLNLVCNGATTPVHDTRTIQAVRALRTICRTHMFQSLSRLPLWIAQLLITKRGFLDSFWNTLPHLSVYSFAKADTAHNQLMHETWNVLHTSEYAYASMWEQLEKERANFYAACYNKLFPILHDYSHSEICAIAFDQDGYLSSNKRIHQLPELLSEIL